MVMYWEREPCHPLPFGEPVGWHQHSGSQTKKGAGTTWTCLHRTRARNPALLQITFSAGGVVFPVGRTAQLVLKVTAWTPSLVPPANQTPLEVVCIAVEPAALAPGETAAGRKNLVCPSPSAKLAPPE